jgi:Pilus formation protein N terminal region
MSVVFGRRRRLIGALALLMAAISAPAQADTLTVRVDQANLLKLPDRVATIVIGNPLIADATLQGGGILVITGKGYGITNLMALDRAGQVVMEKSVRVLGPGGHDLVVVYKGVDRESYSCAPECLPRITLGDSTVYFNATLAETGTRNGQAQSSAATGSSGGGGAPAAR